MADPIEWQEFVAQLMLEINVQGIPNANDALQSMINQLNRAGIGVNQLTSKYGNIKKACRELVKEYKKSADEGEKAFDKIGRSANKMASGFLGISASVRELGGALKQMVVPASLSGAIKTTIDYRKSLLMGSTAVNRLGIGLVRLEDHLIGTAHAAGITRAETIALFDEFQTQMRFVSLDQFESILKRIRNMVGANAEAMRQYQNSIAQVSQEFPELAAQLSNVDKIDKNALQNKINNLYFIGRIGDAEYKRLSAYISGNQQMSAADRKRQKEYQRSVDLQKEFQRQVEKVAITFGNFLLPPLQQLGDLLSSAFKKMEDLGVSAEVVAKTVLGIGAAYAGIKVAKGVLGAPSKIAMLLGASKNVASGTGTMAQGGFMGRLAGLTATPVRVVNFPGGFDTFGGAADQLNQATGNLSSVFKSGMAGRMGIAQGAGFWRNIPNFLTRGATARGIGAATRIGRFGTSVAGGAIALEGAHLLRGQAEKYREAGETGKAELAAGGAVASEIAGFAAIGAQLGSIIPGVGTALGALGGAAIGTAKNFEYLEKKAKKVLGFADDEEESRSKVKYEDELKRIREGRIKSERVEQKIAEQKKEDAGKDMQQILQEVDVARKKAMKELEDVTPQVDARAIREINRQLGDKIKITIAAGETSTAALERAIAEQQKEISDREAALESARSDMDGKEIKAQEEIIQKKKDILDKMHEITSEAGEQVDAYKNANAELAIQNARQQEISGILAQQRTVVSSLTSLLAAQSQYAGEVIERMSIAGQIDTGLALSEIEKGLTILDAEIASHKALIRLLTVEGETSTERLGANKQLTEEQQIYFKELSKIGIKELNQVAVKEEVLKSAGAVESSLRRQTELAGKVTSMYDDQLGYIRASADQAANLVELADNYAIGVGASAEKRMDVYKAEQANINTLHAQLRTLKEMIAVQEQGGVINLRLRKQAKEIENSILQSQIKQSSTVKALRDAWISAISAMNTGAGSFAEIVMDAEQNTAQIMRLGGAVRSAASGAFAMRDAFGQIVEHVGFVTSEKMNQFGDITSMEGRRGYERAYWTPTEERLIEGGYRGPEYREKTEIEELLRGVQTQTRYTVQSGLETLGATGSKMIESAVIGAGGVIRKEVESSNLKEERKAPSFDLSGMPSRRLDFDTESPTAMDIGRDVASELRVGKGDTVPVFVTNFREMVGMMGSTPLPVRPGARLNEPMSQREVIAKVESGGVDTASPEPSEKFVNVSAIIEDEGLTSEMRNYFAQLQSLGLKELSLADVDAEVERVHSSLLKNLNDQKNMIEKAIAVEEEKGLSTLALKEQAFKIEMDIQKALMAQSGAVAHLKKKVEEHLTKDPVQIVYPRLTRRIERIAEEVGLPPKVVMTYYRGFTDRISRVAQEYGLPPKEISALYTGFTEIMERVAINEGLPPTQFIVNYTGFLGEMTRVAKEQGLPPEEVLTTYRGFTNSVTRYAEEQGISSSDLLIRYQGVTKSIEREVQETGLTTDELLMVYTGQMAGEEVERKIRERKKIPDSVVIDYEGLKSRVTATLDHIGLPPDRVPVYYKDMVNTITRYADNIGLPSDKFIVEYRGAIDYIERLAKNVGVPTDEFLIKYSGYSSQFTAYLQEHNIPPEVIPLFLSGYHNEFERGIKEIGLPISDLMVRYPRLSDQIDRIAKELNKPSKFVWVTYSSVVDEVERQAKNVGLPGPEYIVRYAGAVDEMTRFAVNVGLPTDEFFVKYPKVVTEIERIAKEVGLPPVEFLIQYKGITDELTRVAKEIGIPQDKLTVSYYGFTELINRRVSEQNFPKTALPVIYDGFSTLLQRGITEKNIPEDKLKVLYEEFTQIVRRGVKEEIPDEKLQVIFEAFTGQVQRGINEIGLEGLEEKDLPIYYDAATKMLKRGIIEYGFPSTPLIIKYDEFRKKLNRKINELGLPDTDVDVFITGFTNMMRRGVTEFGLPEKDLVVNYMGFTDKMTRMAKQYNIPPKDFPIVYTEVTERLERVAKETGIPTEDLAVKYRGFSEFLNLQVKEMGLKEKDLPVIYRGFTEIIKRRITEDGLVKGPLPVLYDEFTQMIKRGIDEDLPEGKLRVLYDQLTSVLQRSVEEVGLETDPLKAFYKGFTDIMHRGVDEFNLPAHNLMLYYPNITDQIKLMAKSVNMPSDKFMVYYETITKEVDVAAEQMNLPTHDLLVKYGEVTKEVQIMAKEVGLPTTEFLVTYTGITDAIERKARELNLRTDDLAVFYSNITDVLYRGTVEKGLTRDALPVFYKGLTTVLDRAVQEPEVSDLMVYYEDFKKQVRLEVDQTNLPDKDLEVIYRDWIKQVTLGVDQQGLPTEKDKLTLLFEGYKDVMRVGIVERNRPNPNFIIEYPEIMNRMKRVAQEIQVPPEKFQIFYEGYMNFMTRSAQHINYPSEEFIIEYQNTMESMTRTITAFGIPEKNIPLYLKGLKEYYEVTVSDVKTPTVGGVLSNIPKEFEIPIANVTPPLEKVYIQWPEISNFVRLQAETLGETPEEVSINYDRVYDDIEKVARDLKVPIDNFLKQVVGFSTKINDSIDGFISSSDVGAMKVERIGEIKNVVNQTASDMMDKLRDGVRQELPDVPVKHVFKGLSTIIQGVIETGVIPDKIEVPSEMIPPDISKEDKLKINALLEKTVIDLTVPVKTHKLDEVEAKAYYTGIQKYLEIGTESRGIPEKIFVHYSGFIKDIIREVEDVNLPKDKVGLTLTGIKDMYEMLVSKVDKPESVGITLEGIKDRYRIQGKADTSAIQLVKYIYPAVEEEIRISAVKIGIGEGELVADFSQFYDEMWKVSQSAGTSVESYISEYLKFTSTINSIVARSGIAETNASKFKKYFTISSNDIYDTIQNQIDAGIIKPEQIESAMKLIAEGVHISIKEGKDLPLDIENLPKSIKVKIDEMGLRDMQPLEILLDEVTESTTRGVNEFNLTKDPLLVVYDELMNETTRRIIEKKKPSRDFYIIYPEAENKMEAILGGFDMDPEKFQAFVQTFNNLMAVKLTDDSPIRGLIGGYKEATAVVEKYSQEMGQSPEVLQALFEMATGKMDMSAPLAQSTMAIMAFNEELGYSQSWVDNLTAKLKDQSMATDERAKLDEELKIAQDNLIRVTQNLSSAQLAQRLELSKLSTSYGIAAALQEGIANKEKRIGELREKLKVTTPEEREQHISNLVQRASEDIKKSTAQLASSPALLVKALSTKDEGQRAALFEEQRKMAKTDVDREKIGQQEMIVESILSNLKSRDMATADLLSAVQIDTGFSIEQIKPAFDTWGVIQSRQNALMTQKIASDLLSKGGAAPDFKALGDLMQRQMMVRERWQVLKSKRDEYNTERWNQEMADMEKFWPSLGDGMKELFKGVTGGYSGPDQKKEAALEAAFRRMTFDTSGVFGEKFNEVFRTLSERDRGLMKSAMRLAAEKGIETASKENPSLAPFFTIMKETGMMGTRKETAEEWKQKAVTYLMGGEGDFADRNDAWRALSIAGEILGDNVKLEKQVLSFMASGWGKEGRTGIAQNQMALIDDLEKQFGRASDLFKGAIALGSEGGKGKELVTKFMNLDPHAMGIDFGPLHDAIIELVDIAKSGNEITADEAKRLQAIFDQFNSSQSGSIALLREMVDLGKIRPAEQKLMADELQKLVIEQGGRRAELEKYRGQQIEVAAVRAFDNLQNIGMFDFDYDALSKPFYSSMFEAIPEEMVGPRAPRVLSPGDKAANDILNEFNKIAGIITGKGDVTPELNMTPASYRQLMGMRGQEMKGLETAIDKLKAEKAAGTLSATGIKDLVAKQEELTKLQKRQEEDKRLIAAQEEAKVMAAKARREYGERTGEEYLEEEDKKASDLQKLAERYKKMGWDVRAEQAMEAQKAFNEEREMATTSREVLGSTLGVNSYRELYGLAGEVGMTARDIDAMLKQKSIADTAKYIQDLQEKKALYGAEAVGAVTPPPTATGAPPAPETIAGTGGQKVPQGEMPLVAAPESNNIFNVNFGQMAITVQFTGVKELAQNIMDATTSTLETVGEQIRKNS